MCVRACAFVCVRACVRACVRVCLRLLPRSRSRFFLLFTHFRLTQTAGCAAVVVLTTAKRAAGDSQPTADELVRSCSLFLLTKVTLPGVGRLAGT